jgi:hypothetical protein
MNYLMNYPITEKLTPWGVWLLTGCPRTGFKIGPWRHRRIVVRLVWVR